MTDDATEAGPPVLDTEEWEAQVVRRLDHLEERDRQRDSAGRRLVRNGALLILLVTVVGSFGTYRAEHAGHKAEAAADDAKGAANLVRTEAIDRQVAACTSTNEFRRLFRDYLDTQAVGVGSAEAITKLPGFTDLDAPTQEYLRSLVALIDAGATDAQKVRDEYVENFPLADCQKLRRDLEAARPPTPTTTPGQFSSCAEARDAGAAPLRRGEPGYNPALDGDNDGTACDGG